MTEKEILVYHGSNMIIEHPEILIAGFYKDFGYGFYCTNLERQAQRWALAKRYPPIISVYSYCPCQTLKCLSFTDMTEEWLDFVVDCRRGIKHDYDIVDGPMADDQIWDYVEDLVAGRITRAAFWELAKFKRPTHQIVFCTDRSLNTIKFERSYKL